MLIRLLIFLAIVLLIFPPLNWITYRQLVKIHPRRKRWIAGALVAGNLMWPFLPLLNTSTPFMRVTRSLLGPLWFGWLSFALLYLALVVLIFLAWIPFRKRAAFADFARRPSRVFLRTLLIGFVIGCYQALVPLRVERVSLRVPNLPPSAEGTKVALLGDLHVGLFTRRSRLETIFATTNALRPDVVLIAGDLIDDDPYFTAKLLEGTRALAPATPLYAVLGNHEMYGDPSAVIEGLRGSRIRLLVNEGIPFRDLWIAGVADPARGATTKIDPDLGRALAGKPAPSLPIVLAHQPRIIDEARKRGAPIALCAHTHGGQFGFRPLRWSLAGVFLPYHMGLYDLPPTQLYINTGTGYWLIPFRLGMTPEITLIELRR